MTTIRKKYTYLTASEKHSKMNKFYSVNISHSDKQYWEARLQTADKIGLCKDANACRMELERLARLEK